MPAYSAFALVLKRTNLGETDRILTLLTREHGKLKAVAKGSRRSRSRLSGATELFTAVRMLLATGKSLDIVTQAEITDSFPSLRQDIDRLARATYLCEFLDRFTEERDAAAGQELFDIALRGLHQLSAQGADMDLVVHFCELRMLAALGYLPELQRCVRCGASLTGRSSGFSPSLGGALCGNHRFEAEDAVALSRGAVEVMLALVENDQPDLSPISPGESAEIDRALRWYIRYRADRPLRAADFLDQLRAAR
ncbi:MAG TPA: DNA repair protein RecO [Chthonomonadales bacterium]|nr:DNA repair protein RecO [Chthonomonadales bacterium]